MRIVSFTRNGGSPRLGVRLNEQIIDLSIAAPQLAQELVELLAAGPAALDAVAAAAAAADSASRVHSASVQLLPPTTRAGKMICLGINYVDHAAEGGFSKPDYPVLFMRSSSSLIANGAPLIRPSCSDQLDYEGELVAVIGKRARHLDERQALSFVAGYSIFNDASIRDYQLRTSQWTIGKNFDGTGAFGPDFVSADELPPGARGLKIVTRLNGIVVQSADTSDMVFGVAETVARLSECMTLEPGDLLIMGTPAGVGLARKPPLWMKPGDVCEVEIERVGVLRNPVVQEVRA